MSEDAFLSDDEEEEQITAQQVMNLLVADFHWTPLRLNNSSRFQLLAILQSAWLNELFAPELLPNTVNSLDAVLDQIKHMEQNIAQLDKNDLHYVAHQMELERIKYIASSYMRCRLKKIETFTRYILNEDSQRPPDEKRLSDEERSYAERHMELLRKHFHQIAIQHMPQNLHEESARELVTPNLMSHIFLRANESVASVIVGANDEEVDLETGSLHIMPYKLAAELLLAGKVQLIWRFLLSPINKSVPQTEPFCYAFSWNLKIAAENSTVIVPSNREKQTNSPRIGQHFLKRLLSTTPDQHQYDTHQMVSYERGVLPPHSQKCKTELACAAHRHIIIHSLTHIHAAVE